MNARSRLWFRCGLAAAAIPMVFVTKRIIEHVVGDPQAIAAVSAVRRSLGAWSSVGAVWLASVVGDGAWVRETRALRGLRELIGKVARASATVLLRGESGVGKEIVARAIHRASPRANQPFVKVNCAALPAELLESELFGHEKGAFTGAHRRRQGKFEVAHRGTLLLDEIGELPPALQAKLLHVLQDGRFCRVGGEHPVDVDVHLIAATNRDLESAMREGDFREDLYFRLNVIEIHVPPLRERRDEIPVLTAHFLERFNAEYGRTVIVPPETLEVFTAYDWPGNVRELENAVRRMVVLDGAATVHTELLTRLRTERSTMTPADSDGPILDVPGGLKHVARQAARAAERTVIQEVLGRVRWNRTRAARLLQISYKSLLSKIEEYGLDRDGDPSRLSMPDVTARNAAARDVVARDGLAHDSLARDRAARDGAA
jgi:two-component system response regulator AtoC